MATSSKLISRFRRLRYCSSLSPPRFYLLPDNTAVPSSASAPLIYAIPLLSPAPLSSRHFSTRSDDDSERRYDYLSELLSDSGTSDRLRSLSEVSSGEESILPVRGLISLLDWFHDLTGFPWWVTIASSTLAFRVTLLPTLILQLHKLKRISELVPKLPPPFPPPLSGRSFIDQLSLFRRERRALGCPSFLWLFASFFTQAPCFLLWVTTIRRMSLDNHPGFDCGGALWFQNLCDFPQGISAPIFPVLVASLHYINVKITFQRSRVQEASNLFASLLKYYVYYLELLSLPLLFIGFHIPQGSLVYWVTNSSLSSIQHLALQHPAVRAKLGLPDKNTPVAAENSAVTGAHEVSSLTVPAKKQMQSVYDLSPKELLAYSVIHLSKGRKERAIRLLQLALDKDPEYLGASVLIGQIHLQNGLYSEAIECLEHVISKLLAAGVPTEVEDVDNLILASLGTGAAYVRQGKRAEGLVHLERIATLKEPEDSKVKAHYFDGLLMLSSALSLEGRKDEAVKHLRRLVAYNPAYSEFLEQCGKDDEFVHDLVNSRRGDL